MVLRLSSGLDVPLRQGSELLLAAGYAPVWRENGLDTVSLAPVHGALDITLQECGSKASFRMDDARQDVFRKWPKTARV